MNTHEFADSGQTSQHGGIDALVHIKSTGDQWNNHVSYLLACFAQIAKLRGQLKQDSRRFSMSDMNIEQARFNMVEQQVRTWEVLDETVLAILESVPREDFVPDAYRNLAFADIKIPLPEGQQMMPPNVEGRMIQALDVQATDHALEIGTGSGFVTACLAKLAETVTSVDIHASFTQAATNALAEHGINNVELETADALDLNWRDGQRFDVIAVTGSLPAFNDNLAEHLAVGGRMFVITGEQPIMLAQCITRLGESEWQREDLFETSIPALENATPPPSFEF